MSVGSWSMRGALFCVSLMMLGGCVTWEPVRGVPQELIAAEQPSSVRVTDVDGVRRTLKSPMIMNDSIVSAVAPAPGAVVMPPRVGVLAADVNMLELPRVSTGRTIALAGAILGASITWARIQSSGAGNGETPDPVLKDGAFLVSLNGLFDLLLGGR